MEMMLENEAHFVLGSLESFFSNWTIKFDKATILSRPMHSVTLKNEPFWHHFDVLLISYTFWLPWLWNQFHFIRQVSTTLATLYRLISVGEKLECFKKLTWVNLIV